MFGQKSREREMYISEHVAHIRHRPTMVGCSTYTSFRARLCVSSPFFFSFFFFQQRENTYKTIRKGSIVGPTRSLVHLYRCS
jgi:hypothetical protein